MRRHSNEEVPAPQAKHVQQTAELNNQCLKCLCSKIERFLVIQNVSNVQCCATPVLYNAVQLLSESCLSQGATIIRLATDRSITARNCLHKAPAHPGRALAADTHAHKGGTGRLEVYQSRKSFKLLYTGALSLKGSTCAFAAATSSSQFPPRREIKALLRTGCHPTTK